MDLAFNDLPEIEETNLREIFTKYLMKLDVHELFIPPADVLFKIGTTKYNDGGVVRNDYEKPQHSYNSGFLYQKFMAQPLQPREVWLPGKRLKNNNLFLQTIARQLLSKDDRYPVKDKDLLYEQIRYSIENCSRVDISGYGFQYPRVILKCLMEVIEELYPCGVLSKQAQIFYNLLENVKVQMPDGKFVYPPRGIGLGYYEDLKTLAMIALLDHAELISAYGDQFIMGVNDESFGTLIELQTSYGFIVKFDKIHFSSKKSMKWAGYSMSPTQCVKTKDLMSKFLTSFFRDFPWERKDALFSFYQENKEFYESHIRVILREYTKFFNFEFVKKDHYNHFLDSGINCATSVITNGSTRFYDVCRMEKPSSSFLWDPVFVTPFALREVKLFTKKEKFTFHEKRKNTFKKSPPREASLYGYIEPRILYNLPLGYQERVLPSWADMLYLMNYGMSTGSLTYNQDLQTCLNSISRLNLSKNPLYASKRGGYKVVDTERRRPVPSAEWVELKEFLPLIERRSLDYIQRADLPTDPSWMSDEMYQGTNLFTFLEQSKKRSKSEASISTTGTQKKFRKLLKSNIPELISKSRVETLADLIQEGHKALSEVEDSSDHIDSEDDEIIIDLYDDLDIED
jgi:hypothetical protein